MTLYKSDHIYDIFLSSTKRDLDDIRAAAISVIQSLGHRPIAMEFFEAQERNSQDYIGDCIYESDIFIFILGRNYGTKTDDESFVRFELTKARSLGKKF